MELTLPRGLVAGGPNFRGVHVSNGNFIAFEPPRRSGIEKTYATVVGKLPVHYDVDNARYDCVFDESASNIYHLIVETSCNSAATVLNNAAHIDTGDDISDINRIFLGVFSSLPGFSLPSIPSLAADRYQRNDFGPRYHHRSERYARLLPTLRSPQAFALFPLATTAPAVAQASGQGCLGQLMLFGGSYCPQGYVDADGRMLPIAQYSALFSLSGTMYGGNGTQTFGIPDLRGRAPISQGQGPGLPNYTQGETTGSTTTTIAQPNLPAYSPPVNAISGPTLGNTAKGQYLGTAAAQIYSNGNGGFPVQMAPNMIGPLGNSVPMTTQSPIQAIRWCVAVEGIYCSRP